MSFLYGEEGNCYEDIAFMWIVLGVGEERIKSQNYQKY